MGLYLNIYNWGKTSFSLDTLYNEFNSLIKNAQEAKDVNLKATKELISLGFLFDNIKKSFLKWQEYDFNDAILNEILKSPEVEGKEKVSLLFNNLKQIKEYGKTLSSIDKINNQNINQIYNIYLDINKKFNEDVIPTGIYRSYQYANGYSNIIELMFSVINPKGSDSKKLNYVNAIIPSLFQIAQESLSSLLIINKYVFNNDPSIIRSLYETSSGQNEALVNSRIMFSSGLEQGARDVGALRESGLANYNAVTEEKIKNFNDIIKYNNSDKYLKDPTSLYDFYPEVYLKLVNYASCISDNKMKSVAINFLKPNANFDNINKYSKIFAAVLNMNFSSDEQLKQFCEKYYFDIDGNCRERTQKS